jgi:predicted metal-binding membrane protein
VWKKLSGNPGIVLLGLACITALAWVYLLAGTAGTGGMHQMGTAGDDMMTMMRPAWTVGYAALAFELWAVMMIAMMVPTSAHVILEVAGRGGDRPPAASGALVATFFTVGYLLVWIGFGFAATLLQWALDSAHLLSSTMAIRGIAIAAMSIMAVGIYQLTPLKQTALRSCQTAWSPYEEVRGQNARATIPEGARYGVSCLGCCAPLMCLLFVGGPMNVLWMAVITLWMLAEKALPGGSRIARLTGAGLLGWGAVSMAIAIR